MTYKVGYYYSNYSDEDVKDLKEFNSYEDALLNYLERLKEDIIRIGFFSTTLAIGIYKDDEYMGNERLTKESNYI